MVKEKTAEVIEGNKLIAEFMGGKYMHEPYLEYITFNPITFGGMSGGYSCHLSGCLFHSSWDWLMPVVQQIQDIEVTPPPNYTYYRIEIAVQGYVKIEGPFPFPKIFKNVSKCGSLINAVWQAVVEFIKNYNIKNNPE